MSERVICPCKECDHRHIGCHADCEGYQRYAEHRQHIREQNSKEQEIAYNIRCVNTKGIKKH